MEKVKKVSREIPVDEELVLIINDVIHYGTIEVLERIIAEHITLFGCSIEECHIGEFRPLLGVDMKVSREVKVPISEVNEEYDIQDEEFSVYLKGSVYDRFSDLTYAIECVTQLLEDDPTLDEESVSIIRQVVFDCSYDAEIETKVDVTIPPQIEYVTAPPTTQTGGIDWESKNSLYLMQELQKIQDILFKREHDKNSTSI